jgi:hypothetical protein
MYLFFQAIKTKDVELADETVKSQPTKDEARTCECKFLSIRTSFSNHL